MTSTSAPVPEHIAEALNRLWTRFLPEIEHRLALVESASGAASAGALDSATRQAAHEAAHKLAGSLGTFGLQRGTELARQIEHILDEEVPSSAANDLKLWTAELRSLIQSRT